MGIGIPHIPDCGAQRFARKPPMRTPKMTVVLKLEASDFTCSPRSTDNAARQDRVHELG
jgi:hypothetical protein